MTSRVVEHKIKLEKSVKIILGVLAVGVFLNAFAPAFDVRKAFADLNYGDTINVTLDTGRSGLKVWCDMGCN